MEIKPKKIDIGPVELNWLASALAHAGSSGEISALQKIISGMPSIELLEYPAGVDILMEGESGTDFFVVYSGRLSVHKTLEASPEEINGLGKGDFFGEMSFLLSSPRSASVRTEANCRVFKFVARELADLLSRHEALESRIKNVAMERLSRTFKDL